MKDWLFSLIISADPAIKTIVGTWFAQLYIEGIGTYAGSAAESALKVQLKGLTNLMKSKTVLRSDQGFTLVELLVVVGIISVLAGIAIPQYAAYRESSWNSMATSDLRNGVIGQEAAFLDNSEYVPCTHSADCETELPGFQASLDPAGAVVMSVFIFTPSDWNGYPNRRITALSRHQQSNITIRYDSVDQGSIRPQ